MEHWDDHKRRFDEAYEQLSEHDREIAKAKGAKGVIPRLLDGGRRGRDRRHGSAGCQAVHDELSTQARPPQQF